MTDDWKISYSPDTKFISREHSQGGKQSICEVFSDEWGFKIESALSGHLATGKGGAECTSKMTCKKTGSPTPCKDCDE